MPYRAVPSSPRTVTRWAVRLTALVGPLLLLMLVGWAAWGRGQFDEWRVTFLMVYLLLLAVALGAAIVAVVGVCFTAVHKAFSAGYQTGLQVGQATEAARPHGPQGDGNGDGGGGRHLRAVRHADA